MGRAEIEIKVTVAIILASVGNYTISHRNQTSVMLPLVTSFDDCSCPEAKIIVKSPTRKILGHMMATFN